MTTAWGAGSWGSNSWGGLQSEISGVAASGAVGLAVVHRRVVDLEGAFVAAVVDVLLFLLVRVEAGHVNASMVQVRVAIGHPVGHDLAHAGCVFHPHGFGVPQAAYVAGFANGREKKTATEMY